MVESVLVAVRVLLFLAGLSVFIIILCEWWMHLVLWLFFFLFLFFGGGGVFLLGGVCGVVGLDSGDSLVFRFEFGL